MVYLFQKSGREQPYKNNIIICLVSGEQRTGTVRAIFELFLQRMPQVASTPSFIPAKPVRVLRDLMRYRKSLVYQHTQDINRLHKVLETATSKLTSVVSDVWGRSGQNMIKAIMLGESDAEILSELARGTLRGKLPQLQAALEGRIQPHHRLLLQHLFAHLRFLESAMRASPPGDRRADGALSSSGRPLADTSRGASGGRDGLCFGGGQRSEPLQERQTLCLLDWRLPRQSQKSRANTNKGKLPRAMCICARCWPRSSGALAIPKTTTYQRSITDWPVALARRKPSWRSPTRSP